MNNPSLIAAERGEPFRFDPSVFATSVITPSLLEAMKASEELVQYARQALGVSPDAFDLIIKLRSTRPGGIEDALRQVRQLAHEARWHNGETQPHSLVAPPESSEPGILAARIGQESAERLLRLDAAEVQPAIDRHWPAKFDLIIDINLKFRHCAPTTAPSVAMSDPDPRLEAERLIRELIEQAKVACKVVDPDQKVHDAKTRVSSQYVFARLEALVIRKLVELDTAAAERRKQQSRAGAPAPARAQTGKRRGSLRGKPLLDDEPVAWFRAIHKIWPDAEIRTCITRTLRTLKADAAQRSFSAWGEDVTWAVMDTGIDLDHPHFRKYRNLDPTSSFHEDFTESSKAGSSLVDANGHGTHVAGIIAGEQTGMKTAAGATQLLAAPARGSKNEKAKAKTSASLVAVVNEIGPEGERVAHTVQLEHIGGMAPRCNLVSLKVLDDFGTGLASSVITAIAHIQKINGHGRDLKIHGVNLSLGHSFDPQWFACGHSPLCVEVNRLVRSGVVVVVAAGNTGFGTLSTLEGSSATCLDLTINDPGNAELAITVGSTHREMPHKYGVSYFSSKGPTGDGRFKPDLVAPGEMILSCAAPDSALLRTQAENTLCEYLETSGTSMAAPHVSGAIAAFLSIRSEFKGQPERVKEIFMRTATDLGRDRYFQGAGLVDLMRALQSV